MGVKRAGTAPVKVAYIVNRYTTGGLKTLLLSYSQRLDRTAYEVDYLVCSEDAGPHPEIEDYGGKVIRLPKVTRNPLGYILAAKKVMDREGYDIVQSAMNSLNPFALLSAKLAGVPVRISYSLSSSHPSERTTVVKNILRHFGSYCATDLAANAIKSGQWLFGNDSEFHVIANPVNLDVYKYDRQLRDSVREKLGLEGCYVLGHIGRFEYQKNHDFLIRLLRSVADADETARLVLVGWGELEERTMLLVDELGLTDRVINLGKTEDIAGLYNAFDCFVLPSFYEGSPVVGLEAQATGCPCVFSSEVTEEARVNDNVTFVPLDASLTSWVETILSYKGSCRSVASGIERYEANYLAAELDEYYRRLLTRQAG